MVKTLTTRTPREIETALKKSGLAPLKIVKFTLTLGLFVFCFVIKSTVALRPHLNGGETSPILNLMDNTRAMSGCGRTAVPPNPMYMYIERLRD